MHTIPTHDPDLARASTLKLMEDGGTHLIRVERGPQGYWVSDLDRNRESRMRFDCPVPVPIPQPGSQDAFYGYRGEIVEVDQAIETLCKKCKNALTCAISGFEHAKTKDAPPYWTPIT